MACQPVHSFSQWRRMWAMFLLVWPHPTHSVLPTTPRLLPPPLTSNWQIKTCYSRRWYQVRFLFLHKNCFSKVPELCNLIWEQRLSWLTDREQTLELPRALGTGLVSAGLHSTWPFRTTDLFIGLCLCVCVCIYLPMSARVSYVFARLPRGVHLISTMDIYQGWHFLPFCVQTKHTTTCAISALWDVERPDLCDLSVRNYAIVTPTDWFGTLPFLLFLLQ